MQSKAKTPEDYIAELPAERQQPMSALRDTINKHLPNGFEEVMDGMIGWVVPHSLFPDGYHCDPKQPLPFLGLASQKNYIALYHMGLYSDPKLTAWFQKAWARASPAKLDMGKCCLRMKKPEHIPFDLIAELAAKITPGEWIDCYVSEMRPK